jgi:hypothetical protein
MDTAHKDNIKLVSVVEELITRRMRSEMGRGLLPMIIRIFRTVVAASLSGIVGL